MDKSIFTRSGEQKTTPDDLLGLVDGPNLNPSVHCGVCITMTGWQDAWGDGRPRRQLEHFVTEVGEVALSKGMAVYGARSKWVGLDLIDKGLTFAGTLLNGRERLFDSSSGIDPKSPEAFGKTPIYGECREVAVTELFTLNGRNDNLYQPKELHRFDGIPSTCDPALLSDSGLFRVKFAKPRRVATHTQEAREIRDALRTGVLCPGREYIKKSGLWKGVRQ